MKISVVIVNYNVRHFLEQCLISVFRALEGIDGEVFVVDNNSVDGSCAMVREKFPMAKLIENKQNTGFSKANNQAIRLSTAEYVLLLNPDTVVEEDTFRKVLSFMDATPECGALGVQMVDGDGQFLPESKRGLPTPWVAFYKIFGLATLLPGSRKFGKYHLSYLDKNQNHSVEVLSGAFMLLRKSVLDKIGLLDEDFFMYGEDIDLSYRVLKAGYRNYYFADTRIIHYKGESTKKGSLNYVRVFYQAMIIFAQKHFAGQYQRSMIFLINLAVYFRAFMAVLNRMVRRFGFPVLEMGMIYLITFLVKEYWEHNIKFIEGGAYPRSFDLVAAPAYTLTLVACMALAGAYRRPYRFRSVLTGAAAGFVAIATFSYILPQYNFSRAIVGLTATFTIFSAAMARAVLNWKKTGKFFFSEAPRKRILVAGMAQEAVLAARQIRNDVDYPVDIVGVAAWDQSSSNHPLILGNKDQLDEIIHFYHVDEVVFTNKGVPTGEIIDLMGMLYRENLTFKIIPPDADYVIGPQEIYGGLYIHQRYALQRTDVRLRKRAFDIISSAMLLLTYPLHAWLYQRPTLAFRNLVRVLSGDRHMVGYIQEHPTGLPAIKVGLLNMLHRIRQRRPVPDEQMERLDRHYARTCSLSLDIETFLKGIRHLGDPT